MQSGSQNEKSQSQNTITHYPLLHSPLLNMICKRQEK